MELEYFKISSANDLFLLFLPNFSMGTTLSYIISNSYVDIFYRLYPKIVKYFSDFVSNQYLIEKIINMFIYKFQYKTKYPNSSVKNYYCGLGYDGNYFEDDGENENESEFLEKANKFQDLLKEVEQIISKNPKFSSLDFL
jgi:hypothetical protein